MKITKSAKVTLWAGRILALLLAVLVFLLPRLLGWYLTLRPLGSNSAAAILIGFYCCVPAVGLALWNLDRLLRSILQAQVFTGGNVRRIGCVRWCCLAVGLICLPAAYFYPPLIFMVIIMAFLSLAVSVLRSVMAAAVEIRAENDLTV